MHFIASTASVDEYSHVGGEARVEGYAILKSVKIWDHVVITGSAQLSHSSLYGAVIVEGRGIIIRNCSLNDDVQVKDNAVLINCTMGDEAQVYGNAEIVNIHVHGDSCVFGDAKLGDGRISVQLLGSCKFGGHATFKDLPDANSFVTKYGEEKVEVINRSSVILTDVWDMG